jgi:hypothetical protein
MKANKVKILELKKIIDEKIFHEYVQYQIRNDKRMDQIV